MKNNLSTVTTGAGLVALSALGYATNPIFGKFAYGAGANAVTLGAIRFTVAAIGLWLILALQGKTRGVALGLRARLLALGVLGLAMVSLLYFTALEHIDASLATGLFYTYPAAVAVVGLLRGDGLSRWGIVGLLTTAAGTWMLLGTLGGFTWQGILLILAAAGVYTAFIIVGERWTSQVSPTVAAAHMTSGAALVYLTITLVTQPALPGAGAYLAGAGLSLCSTILAISTFFAGLPMIGPARASIISTLEPVFTTMLAVVLLGDQLTMLQTAGMALVVTGAVAAQWRDTPRATAQQT